MSKVVICDFCGEICQRTEYLELSGWWGKHQQFSTSRRKSERWTLERKQDREGLTSDVCRLCVDTHLKFVAFSLEKTREALLRERRHQRPDESLLTAHRHVSGTTVEGVNCDRCKVECIDRHLRLRSKWQTPDGAVLSADLCEACVDSELRSRIRFETIPSSPIAETPSAG